MPETMFVIPAANLQVRDPRNAQPIPAEGASVPRSAYWLRRLAEGDVAESKPPRAKKPGKE